MSGDQVKLVAMEVRLVRGAAVIPNKRMAKIDKTQKTLCNIFLDVGMGHSTTALILGGPALTCPCSIIPEKKINRKLTDKVRS